MGYLRWALTVALMVVAAMRGKGPLYRVLVEFGRTWRAAVKHLRLRRAIHEHGADVAAVFESGDLNADAKGQYGEAVEVPTALYGHLNITHPYGAPDLAARLAAAHERERADLARRMRERGM